MLRVLALLVAAFGLAAGRVAAEPIPTRWVMLHVQGQIGQADCHLVTLPDGRHVLIDAGEAADAPGAVVSQLRRHGVTRLTLAIVSHFHADHYGRLLDVLDSGITIDRVVVNPPGDRRIADRELPWGCNYDHVMETLASLHERGVPYDIPRAGARLIESTTAEGVAAGIDVVCAYDGIKTPIGETDINDTSVILRLFHGTTRVLFTGDLNHALGGYLATSGADIRADILKAPHHGTEGCAPNEFFDRVDASAVLVPSPTALWFSRRSSRTRGYFAERAVPTLVNGLHGNVTVSLSSGSFRIQSEIRGFDAEFVLKPRIILPPVAARVGTGANLTLAVTTADRPAPTLQWMKDGRPILGATQSTHTLPAATTADAGLYSVEVTNAHGTVTSPPASVVVDEQLASLAPTTLTNLSARGWAGPGDATLIAGFVVGGQGCKRLLVRAVGPTLTELGIGEPLPDPRLLLTTVDGRPIGRNDNWSATSLPQATSEAAARVGAFPLPVGGMDAALLLCLPPGAYTALANDRSGATGIALIELYDLDPTGSAHLINLSARAEVKDAEAALIAGFATEGLGNTRVLCRAVGPSLERFGVNRFLHYPSLSIHGVHFPTGVQALTTDASGDPQEMLAQATTDSGAFPLVDGANDVASLLTLPRGLCTAVVSSADATTGIGLVELYVVP